jgi:hypothetical protein
MSVKNNNLVNLKQGNNKLRRHIKIAPLSDPFLVLVPWITEVLRAALLKQSASVDALLKSSPTEESQDAIQNIIEGMNDLFDLLPHIEAAVEFATDSGWRYGANQGVSEQNRKNVTKGHKKSELAKQKFVAHWIGGKWKTKAACVRANYEQVLRESGLWKADVVQQKPEIETFIRYLQTIKK